jgi:hypothetical protein
MGIKPLLRRILVYLYRIPNEKRYNFNKSKADEVHWHPDAEKIIDPQHDNAIKSWEEHTSFEVDIGKRTIFRTIIRWMHLNLWF